MLRPNDVIGSSVSAVVYSAHLGDYVNVSINPVSNAVENENGLLELTDRYGNVFIVDSSDVRFDADEDDYETPGEYTNV